MKHPNLGGIDLGSTPTNRHIGSSKSKLNTGEAKQTKTQAPNQAPVVKRGNLDSLVDAITHSDGIDDDKVREVAARLARGEIGILSQDPMVRESSARRIGQALSEHEASLSLSLSRDE